ncbi:MAG: NAD+ synthase [Verrucomicrobiota bacterium]
MNVGCLQINTKVGDFTGNAEKILGGYKWCVHQGAELVIAPELSISGYPPRDLLLYENFVAKDEATLLEIIASVGAVPLIVGCLTRNSDRPGKALFNSAVVLQKQQEVARVHKSLIPTYDVFDEDRYFEAGSNNKVICIGKQKIGVTICEDIWNDEDYWDDRLYECDPVKDLADKGVDLLVNISASPWHLGKEKTRFSLLSEIARQHRVSIVQVNLIGGNDELIFDGQSLVVNANGDLLAKGNEFGEDIFVMDTKALALPSDPWKEDETALFYALSKGTADYVRKCGFEKVAIGLSGGIDSALTAVIAVDALGPDNVLGVMMPSQYSSEGSIKDAEALAAVLEIETLTMPIKEIYNASLNHMAQVLKGSQQDVTEENLQARLRGLTMMAISNKQNRLILTTGNKSELAIGYCTLYGDMCGGLAVISDVTKMQVYQLAKWINRKMEIIPNNTITKPPSAELAPNQKDQDTLPAYEELDQILKAYIEESKSVKEIVGMGHDEFLVRDIIRKVDLNEYKRRQAAPGLKITPKAFGSGRRMPIAQRFKHT